MSILFVSCSPASAAAAAALRSLSDEALAEPAERARATCSIEAYKGRVVKWQLDNWRSHSIICTCMCVVHAASC